MSVATLNYVGGCPPSSDITNVCGPDRRKGSTVVLRCGVWHKALWGLTQASVGSDTRDFACFAENTLPLNDILKISRDSNILL